MQMYSPKILAKVQPKGSYPKNSGKTWKPTDEAKIDAAVVNGKSLIAVALELERTLSATVARACQLGWFVKAEGQYNFVSERMLLAMKDWPKDAELGQELVTLNLNSQANLATVRADVRGAVRRIVFSRVEVHLNVTEVPEMIAVINSKGELYYYEKVKK